MLFEIGGMISMKRLLVCLALILSFVCMPIGNQNSFGATKTKAQSKFVSNKVLKKWKKGWHSRSGRKYYCVKKGKLAKGWKKIGKNKSPAYESPGYVRKKQKQCILKHIQ